MNIDPEATHDHQLDLVLLCGTCGLVMAPPDSQLVVIRYVAPTVTNSDNLTTADPAQVTFDIVERKP
jgi:hypothetical protein